MYSEIRPERVFKKAISENFPKKWSIMDFKSGKIILQE